MVGSLATERRTAYREAELEGLPYILTAVTPEGLALVRISVDPDALRTFARMLIKVAEEVGARGTGARTSALPADGPTGGRHLSYNLANLREKQWCPRSDSNQHFREET
jgi:hypothetical protein